MKESFFFSSSSSYSSTVSFDRFNNSGKKERWVISFGRFLAPFLFCSFAATLIFTFFINRFPLPNSFKSVVKQQYDRNSTTLPFNGRKEEGDDDKCDWFTGRWVRDLNGSAYTNWSCPSIPVSKNCFRNGREDRDFLNWKWKPDGCELPRFDSRRFLLVVRGKTMAFVGDSVARNHLESLLCLLSKEEIPTKAEEGKNKSQSQTWHFPNHNFTLMMLWSRFLVAGEERVINGTQSGIFDLHLDKVDSGWADKLPVLDYAIISAGHWFFRKIYLHTNGKATGCIYCDDPNVTNRDPSHAIGMSFRTALDFAGKCEECRRRGLTAVVRTFSPSHFENGTWNDGGRCNRTGPQRHGVESQFGGNHMEISRIQREETDRARKKYYYYHHHHRRRRRSSPKNKPFRVVDVTKAMLMRPDGHPGEHWDNMWMKGYNDCVHWCLPGPIDTWNQFLMAILSS